MGLFSGSISSAPQIDASQFFNPRSLSLSPGGTQTSTQAVPNSTTPNTLKELIQNTAGAAGRAGISAALTFAPKSVRDNIGSIMPEEDLGKFPAYVLGNEPITSLSEQAHSTDHAGYGLFNKPIGYTAAFGGAALNLMPVVGGLEKGGADLLANALIKTSSVESATNMLLKAGFHPEIADMYAKEFIKMTNPNDVRAALQSATKLQTTISHGVADVKTPEHLAEVPQQPAVREPIMPPQERPVQPTEPLPTSGAPKENVSSEERYFNPDEYVKEQTALQDAARKAESGGMRGAIGGFLDNAKTKIVDFTAPIEDTLRTAVKNAGIELSPTEDIHNQIDRVLRAPTIAGQFAHDNGLVDLIRKVPDLKILDQYMIAKHAQDLAARGIETGRNLTKDKSLATALAPTYEEFAQRANEYSQKLLDVATESGLISKDSATMLKERYPNYVPFERVFNEAEQMSSRASSKGISSLSTQTAVRTIKGSTRQIESPLQSLLARTQEVVTQAEKNKAGELLAGYRDLPGNPFQLRELEPGEAATGKATISYFDNGTKRTFQTTPTIAQAAKSLDVQQMNILGKIFSIPVRVARIGITGINIPFTLANVSKDQVTAFINSEKPLATSLANPVNFVKSLMSVLRHDQLYQDMVRAGGAGTSFDLGRQQIIGSMAKIRSGKGAVSTIAYTVTHPADLLRTAENIIARSEELTRLQQYRATRLALLKQGMTEADAATGAARAARENTVNFARHGEWGPVINSTVLYLNAGVQGTRTLLRNLKEKPIATVTKIATAAFLPVASATFWNLNDPKRAAAYADIPEYEKQNNIIIIPPNPTKDANGKWNVIKVPLSQEIQNIVNLVRRPIEAMHGGNPVTFAEAAQALLGTVEPVNPDPGSVLSTLVPQAVKPTVEEAVNKNLFTGYPVVPDKLNKLSPSMQVKPNTSGTAREIAGLFNGSPIKTEDFIKETFGGIGPQILNASDRIQSGVEGALGVPANDRTVVGGIDPFSASSARFNKAAGGATEQAQTNDAAAAVRGQADQSQQTSLQAEAIVASIKGLDKQAAADKLNEATANNPALTKAVQKVLSDNAKGLTVSDKMVSQLQIGNGERAKYIDAQVRKLTTQEAKLAYLNDLATKKIITAQVQQQLYELWNKK